MPANDDDIWLKARAMIRYAPTDEEYREWMLSMAGDHPGRRAAVSRWLAVDGLDLFDLDEDRIVEINCEHAQLQLEDLQPINLFPEIRSVRFESTELTDEMLRVLAKHRTLQELHIDGGCDAGDLAIELFSQLPDLRSLSVAGCGVTDDGASHLASYKSRLIILCLRNNKELTSAIGPYVARLTQLRWLDLVGTGIGDECLGYLKELDGLETLSLGETVVTDKGVRELSSLVELKSLGLSGTKVTNIRHLSSLKKLKVLGLENTKIGDDAMTTVADLTKLYHLHLSGTRITNLGVARVGDRIDSFSSLGNLELRDTAIDDGCVPALEAIARKHPHVQLDIRGTKISLEGARRILTHLKYPRMKSDFRDLK